MNNPYNELKRLEKMEKSMKEIVKRIDRLYIIALSRKSTN